MQGNTDNVCYYCYRYRFATILPWCYYDTCYRPTGLKLLPAPAHGSGLMSFITLMYSLAEGLSHSSSIAARVQSRKAVRFLQQTSTATAAHKNCEININTSTVWTGFQIGAEPAFYNYSSIKLLRCSLACIGANLRHLFCSIKRCGIRPLSGTSSFSNDTVRFTRFFVYYGDRTSQFFFWGN